MINTRLLTRAAPFRATRSLRVSRCQQCRFQSTSSASPSSSPVASSFGAGLAGGFAGALILYGMYSLTPAGKTQRTINKAARQANQKYQAAAKKLQESSPNADQAIDSIKQFAYSYVGWIPGGRDYVDKAFKDIETVRQNHKEEADQIVNDAYKQLQDAAKSGLSLETLSKVYGVITDLSTKLAKLGGDALFDVLDNHPELKEKLGGNVDQLKQLGDQYGPEVKKQVDETWEQIKEIVAGGLSAENVEKARKLIDDKVQKVKEFKDEAWKKGLEAAKPLLDKNPKVKELVEKNADALKEGNATELFDRLKSAVESGDLGGFESYVNSAVEKAKSKTSELSGGRVSLDQYTKLIPNGEEILPKLQQLREIADKHKDEGEKLLNDTLKEIKQVLDKRAKEAEGIVGKAKKEAK